MTKINTYKSIYWAALVPFLAAPPAIAQEAGAPPAEPASATEALAQPAADAAASPAAAAPDAATAAPPPLAEPSAVVETAVASRGGDDIGEVIVTARRVQERLQDVPISMTVFNQEQLTSNNVLSGRDLATFTPSLSANGRYGTENTSFSIRGFSQENRTTASVGVYFADVVAPRGGGGGVPGGDGAGPGSFFDLENVQVLKGPQGTLFGRNTTGGAVLLVPRKPTADDQAYFEQSLGSYSLVRTQAVVNVPVSESLRLRAGIDHNSRDGYLHNTTNIGPEDFADVNYTAGRLSAVLDIAPNLENYTIGSFSRSDTNGQLPRIIAYNVSRPETQPFDCAAAVSLGIYACQQLAANAAAGNDGYYDVQNSEARARTLTEQWQVINTTTWTATDTLTVKNIVSYAELDNRLYANLFGTRFFAGEVPFTYAVSAPPPGIDTIAQSTMTEELQLQGTARDGRLQWQAGAYYESSRGTEPSGTASPSTISCTDPANLECFDVLGYNTSVARGLPPGTVRVGNVNWQVGEMDWRNLAVYGQTTYGFTDTLQATAGLRYTKDRSKADNEGAVRRFIGEGADEPVTFCISPDSGVPLNQPVASVSDCKLRYSKTTDAPTWLVGLDYKPNSDLMLYGKYARGYRQGSVSPLSAPGYTSYDAEKVDTYELGIKTGFHGAVRGNFNVAAFYNDFTDQQLLVGFASSTSSIAPNAGVVNAGSSRIYGAEVESTLLPFRGMNLGLSYAYLNSKLEQIEAVELPDDSLFDRVSYPSVAGSPLPYSPRHKAVASATYTLPFDARRGDVSVGLVYSYQSELFINASSPYGVIPAFELVNLNLGWARVMGTAVDLALFATNALDKKYYSGTTGTWASGGFETMIVGEPRMVGARLRMNFGG